MEGGGVAKKKESYRSLSKKKIELCAFDFRFSFSLLMHQGEDQYQHFQGGSCAK